MGFSNPEAIANLDEWVNLLFVLSIATHFDQNWAWHMIYPMLSQVYQVFCTAGLAGKTPVALYWPNALAPLFYYHPREKGFVDLGRAILTTSDRVSRACTVKFLCLSRDAAIAKYAAEVLLLGLKDPNEIVRAETILSLVKCGYIPEDAKDLLNNCLNHPRTYLPAASALFHITGSNEYFSILKEAAKNRKSEVVKQAAHALDPWPSRQCAIASCGSPLRFQEYWMEWRKHTTTVNFVEAFQIWRSPAVKLFCCDCYDELTKQKELREPGCVEEEIPNHNGILEK